MNKLIERFSDIVKGSIAGFDRIVFKGMILPSMSAAEAISLQMPSTLEAPLSATRVIRLFPKSFFSL